MPFVLINGDTEFLDPKGDKRGSTTAVEKSIKRNKVDARVVRSVPVASQQ